MDKELLVYLAPGIFATFLFELILHTKRKDSVYLIFEAFILSVIINALTSVIWNNPKLYHSLIVGVLIVVSYGYCYKFNLLMRLLRKIQITDKSSREDIWLEVFQTYDRYIITHMKNDFIVYGYPIHISEKSEGGIFFLWDCYRLTVNDENLFEYVKLDNTEGLMLKFEDVEYIQFTKTKPVR